MNSPAPDNTPTIDLPGLVLPHPQYASACHAAPVKKLHFQKVKYFCTECGQPCLPRTQQ